MQIKGIYFLLKTAATQNSLSPIVLGQRLHIQKVHHLKPVV